MRLESFEQQTLRVAAAVIPASRFCVYRVGRDLEPYAHVVLGGDTRWIDPYMNEYRAYDPIHPRYFVRSERSVFRLSDAVCDRHQFECYRDGFQRRMGVAFKAEVFLRDELGRIVAGLRLARHESLGEFDADIVTRLETLEPVLSAALRAARREDALESRRTGLTEREREVLDWVAEGVSNKIICRRMGLALPTVKCHVKNVLRKVGASTRAELIAKLYRSESR